MDADTYHHSCQLLVGEVLGKSAILRCLREKEMTLDKGASEEVTFLRTYKVHANEYIEDLEALVGRDNVRYSAQQKIQLVVSRIKNHMNHSENWAECIPCESEPMILKRIGEHLN